MVRALVMLTTRLGIVINRKLHFEAITIDLIKNRTVRTIC